MIAPCSIVTAGEREIQGLASWLPQQPDIGWSLERLMEDHAKPGYKLFAAVNPADNRHTIEVGGFLLSHTVSDESSLLIVAVNVTRRSRGIGKQLVCHFLEDAAARGCRHAFLEVRQSNQSAISVYQATGFELVGKRNNYYAAVNGKPSEAALLYRKALLV